MDRIESLIAQAEEYLQMTINNRDHIKELITLPDGTIDHHYQERLDQLNAAVDSAQAAVAKTKELRDPPRAVPIPDEVIAKAADEAAAASAQESFAHKTLRNKVIEILIATHGMSEGHTADAILSALTATRVPEGWSIMPSKYGFLIIGPDGRISELQKSGVFGGDDVVFDFFRALLTAAGDQL